MDTLLFALHAILPIILLIFFGYFLKCRGFLDEAWFKKGNKLIFHICLPAMLFINVYSIDSLTSIPWSVVIYTEAVIIIAFFLGMVLVHCCIPDARQKGVILQCVFRSNYAIIGLPLAESLGGSEGLKVAAVLTAFSIPTFNILAVIALTIYQKGDGGQKISLSDILKKIVKNPLIQAVLCGLLALVVRALLPVRDDNTPVFTLSRNLPSLFSAINSLSKISSPLALMILGGLFSFSAIRELKKQIFIGTAVRTVVVPFSAICIAALLSKYTSLFTFDSTVYPAMVALFGSPVAVSSAIMAQEMDNDGVLAGQLVVWTSIVSVFTLFLLILLLRSLGLL